jgi:HK97 family phage major capsid protein
MFDFDEKTDAADPANLPAVIDQLGRAFEEFKSKNETEIKEIKAGIKAAPADMGKVEEALTKLHAAKDAMELKLAGEVKARQQLEALLTRPGLGHNGGPALDEAEKQFKSFHAMLKAGTSLDAQAYADYRKSFGPMLRKAEKAISAEEHKALSIGVDPDGGYIVPPDISGRIVTRIFETSPMRSVASVQVIGTDALEGLRDTDEMASGGWVAETANRPETNTAQFAKWRIPVFELFAQPAATQSLLDDNNVDVEGWLAMKVADRLTRVENTAFITGDGVNKPRGIAAYPTAATHDATRPWGTFEHVNTGANGAFLTTAVQADCLFDLIGAFKDAYLANAGWMTRREAITAVRKMKEATTNAYIWQPGLERGRPQQLLGFPVTIAQDMPALGTGSLSMAFGDFREAYQIVDRAGFRTLRDPYTAKPYVRFYTTRRVGGGALQFEAVKFIRFSA